MYLGVLLALIYCKIGTVILNTFDFVMYTNKGFVGACISEVTNLNAQFNASNCYTKALILCPCFLV